MLKAERKRCASLTDLNRLITFSRTLVGWCEFPARLFSPLCRRCSTPGMTSAFFVVLQKISVYPMCCGRTGFISPTNCGQNIFCIYEAGVGVKRYFKHTSPVTAQVRIRNYKVW